MKLNNISEKLKANSFNTFEYVGKKEKFKKKYSEIYPDVLKTLNFLRNKGIKRNERIGILGGNTYEWLLVDLACILGRYVSVSFHEKDFEKELDGLHARYNLKLLFLEEKYIEKIPGSGVISLNSLRDLPAADLPELQEPKNTAVDLFEGNDVFTIIFTSGTTGFPRGIEMKVKSAEDFLINLVKRFSFHSDDKIIVFFPLSISVSKLFIYGAILLGFNIVMTVPENFTKILRTAQPTILQGVPYLFETIYASIYQKIRASLKKYLLFKLYLLLKNFFPQRLKKKLDQIVFKEIINFWGGKMRFMVTGAAPISKKVLKFYNDIGINLYEAYGVSEAGLVAINSPQFNRPGSVGKPFSNKEVIIDEEGQILVRGEFCWASKYVDGSPEINEQVFKNDGYIATGDIGYFDKDGFLYLKGRIKELLVLSNGEKVHPTIIENELKNSFYIKQSIVFGDNKPYISAIIVKNDHQLITYDQLKDEITRINKKLPRYMQIKNFIVAKEPFTTSNGLLNSNLKLNRPLIYSTYKTDLANL